MKSVFVLLFALLAVAITSANQCGPYQCGFGYSCVFDGQHYACILNCPHVTISQRIVNQWADNNGKDKFVQVEVTLRNNGPRSVDNVVVGTDSTMQLRDQYSIWNVIRMPSGDIVLPTYNKVLSAGETHTFGYINKGTAAAHLYIKNVHLL